METHAQPLPVPDRGSWLRHRQRDLVIQLEIQRGHRCLAEPQSGGWSPRQCWGPGASPAPPRQASRAAALEMLHGVTAKPPVASAAAP